VLSNLTRTAACLSLLVAIWAHPAHATECDNYQTVHSQWLWCDSFESDADINTNYFDVDRAGGRMTLSGDSPFDGSNSLQMQYVTGQVDSGSIKLSLGETPISPMHYTNQKFDELYWRFYMKVSSNWVGQPYKVTRGIVFAGSNWSEAAIGHLWEDSDTSLGLGLDPATGVVGSTVVTTQYNDFANLTWLGKYNGAFQMYAPANANKWTCIEVHMKLNTPGKSDGVLGFSVNGQQQAQATALNFRGSYTTYGINAITLEGWVNPGAPQVQYRWFDNFVVSTQPIGCAAASGASPPPLVPNPPTNVVVQ
jgi:hypothetical protein